jgi:D-sedoheptulose 7-phosphate isomerase
MVNKFYYNYFDSIQKGLVNSVYQFNKQKTDPDLFFKKIKELLCSLRKNRNKIYFFGNGASAAFANHMALDFSKNGKILSRSLSDSAMLTALSNDFSYEKAMEEYLKIEGVTINDLVITISSSGNSPNIVNALIYCKANNIKSFSLSGLERNNKSIEIADYSIYVPMKTYGMVECIHQIYLHMMLDEYMEICEWDRIEFQNMSIKNFQL